MVTLFCIGFGLVGTGQTDAVFCIWIGCRDWVLSNRIFRSQQSITKYVKRRLLCTWAPKLPRFFTLSPLNIILYDDTAESLFLATFEFDGCIRLLHALFL